MLCARAVNGTLCNAGFEAAAIALRDAVGMIELVIVRRPDDVSTEQEAIV